MAFNSLIFAISLIISVSCWDQIKTVVPRAIFPFVQEDLVVQLVDELNVQNSTSDQMEVLEKWADENWVRPATTPTPTSPFYYGRLVEKNFATEQAKHFLRNRAAIKAYIRYLYRATQILDYFTEEQAVEMRKQFWKTDGHCYNDFSCTKTNFYMEMSTLFADFHPDVSEHLKELAKPLDTFPGYGEQLEFVLKKD